MLVFCFASEKQGEPRAGTSLNMLLRFKSAVATSIISFAKSTKLLHLLFSICLYVPFAL